jgi:hypothetical protein|tara:strand:- start:545 stop:901 length:357 start_codon:yes stop_codon:yes gene_type:complete
MENLSREDKVQRLLQKQIDIKNQLKDMLEKCSCTADCKYHVLGKLEVQLSDVLLDETLLYFLKEEAVKLYTSDIDTLMTGLKNFAEDAVTKKISLNPTNRPYQGPPSKPTRRAIDDFA